jgi:hypothetical protein
MALIVLHRDRGTKETNLYQNSTRSCAGMAAFSICRRMKLLVEKDSQVSPETLWRHDKSTPPQPRVLGSHIIYPRRLDPLRSNGNKKPSGFPSTFRNICALDNPRQPVPAKFHCNSRQTIVRSQMVVHVNFLLRHSLGEGHKKPPPSAVYFFCVEIFPHRCLAFPPNDFACKHRRVLGYAKGEALCNLPSLLDGTD